MGWADLLQKDETVVAPWLGGRRIVSGVRRWTIDGPLPPEHGWYSFSVTGGRKARTGASAVADPELFARSERICGYLIGNRLMADDVALELDSARIIERTRVVHLLEPGLDRFSRIQAAVHDERLVYLQPEFPLGPEGDVLEAFEDRRPSIDHVAGVTPALHMVYRWHSWWRDEREQQIRAEEERQRREEEQRRREEEEERRRIERAQAAERERLAQEALERRRQQEARGRRRAGNRSIGSEREHARRVLAEAGAELLDWTQGRSASQAIVSFRYLGRRFRSVVRVPGLRIVEAGICLTDSRSGERGDDRFTLASLPAVIAQAERQNQLVILRW
ncbi:hypothetical protein [Paraliomyxa miuraensis]|uniref:hypothetical protein n=1 Tax=Paraliomyxa miuraensis TaxID=376150 RepID=UPI00224E340C|nr:hypothetical protein [Paraliomyxa miuraensis]MCX4247013.1 hypothetical protein [Paraliomyxa miuraensis]